MKNEKEDSLFLKLMDSYPNTWPALWRKQAEPFIEISRERELEILNLIRGSNRKIEGSIHIEKKPFFSNRILQFVSMVAVIFLGVLLFYSPKKTDPLTLKILKKQGESVLIRDQSSVVIREGMELELRDRILISNSSSLTLAFSNQLEDLFYIDLGEDTEVILNTHVNKYDKSNLELVGGSIFIFSEKMMDTNFSITNLSTTFQLIGTKALIQYKDNLSSIKLLEGKFKIKQSNKELEIREDQEISFKKEESILTNRISNLSSQSKEELNQLNRKIKNLENSENISRQKNIKSNPDKKSFQSLAEIKKEFGSLQEIVLQDGNKLIGFSEIGDEKCIIFTVNKSIEIERFKIKEINELNE